MNDRGVSQAGAEVRARATGFVSAVLLVVLLGTTGWPAETRHLAERHVAGLGHVACHEAEHAAAVTRAVERRERAPQPALRAVAVAAPPRIAHRQQRIDSGGLPPPRAPTAS